MITRDTNYSIQHLRGLSADSKPLDVPNGSSFLEMDTGKKYLFDAQNSAWLAQGEQGGGNNGGVFYVSIEDVSEDEHIITPNIIDIAYRYNNGDLPVLHNIYTDTFAYLRSVDTSSLTFVFATPPDVNNTGVSVTVYTIYPNGSDTSVDVTEEVYRPA